MPRLTNARITAQLQRKTEEAFYSDTAYVLIEVATGTYDVYNNAVTTLQENAVDCSFTDKVSRENWLDYADIETIDAEIRFSDCVPKKGYKVKLAGMYDGLGMADKTYEIVGIRDRDTFGYLCALSAVTV